MQTESKAKKNKIQNRTYTLKRKCVHHLTISGVMSFVVEPSGATTL